MNKSYVIRAFWDEFCRSRDVDSATPYQVWYFGLSFEGARELAGLVLEGKKTATASIPWEYESRPYEAPVLGGYSVITDFEGRPMCVVRTTEVRVLPFDEVDAAFASDEGEGDQSLEYWRRVHWDYFSRRLAAIGKQPNETMPVICERFELLYPKHDK